MANSSKRKGDRAELEVEGILRDLLGVPARRALGAGRKDDVGDIHGVPDTVIQVVNWKDVAKAVREKPLECARQGQSFAYGNHGMGPIFEATFVRLRSSRVLVPETMYPQWRVVSLVEPWATMWREAQ